MGRNNIVHGSVVHTCMDWVACSCAFYITCISVLYATFIPLVMLCVYICGMFVFMCVYVPIVSYQLSFYFRFLVHGFAYLKCS